MSRKKAGLKNRHQQIRSEEDTRAPTLRGKYPQLEELIISLKFKEPDWGTNPAESTRVFKGESKAFFDFECPYFECVAGGFNLLSAVSEMVAEGKSETAGSLICKGWQDEERINKHRCLLKLNYSIKAKYRHKG